MIEAECTKCGEIFIPEDENDLIHGIRNDGEECGGKGEIKGEWVLSTRFQNCMECNTPKRVNEDCQTPHCVSIRLI